MPRVSVGEGVEVFYRDLGTGPPVMLVHGGFMSHRVWEGQAYALAEAGYRVVAPDLRGHGASSTPDCSYTAEMHARDLRALCQALDLDRVNLVGWSLGSTVAATFALAYPDRLDRLVLVTSAVFNLLTPDATGEAEETEELVARIRGKLLENRPRAMERFVTGMGVEFDKWTTRWLWGIAMQTPLHVGLKTLDLYLTIDAAALRNGLGDLDIPVGVFHGARDRSTTITAAETIATDLLPRGTYVQFDDSAHAPFLDEPGTFTRELLGFLDE